MGSLILLFAFVAIFYVMIILPQRRNMRARQAMIAALSVGSEVMTTAGMYGRVTAIDGDDIRLEVAPGLELRMVRGSIGKVLGPAPNPIEPAPHPVEPADGNGEPGTGPALD